MPSQDYTADDSSNRCFECSKMQLLEQMCESGRRLLFPISWKTNGKQMIVYHSDLYCGAIATCKLLSKKCFVREQLLLDLAFLKHPNSRLLFTFGVIRINPRFITYHDPTRTNFFDDQMFMQY